jgi:cation:H+ antiporter
MIELLFIPAMMLILGIALLLFSSDKTVELASDFAKDMGISPFLVGIVVLAAGTSIPEIANSVVSSYAGYGDINVGDTFGSCLSQITLVLGILALVSVKPITGGRKDIMLLGGCAIIAGMLALLAVEKGAINRLDAVLLMVAYPIFLFITQKYSVKEYSLKYMPRLDIQSFVQVGLILLGIGGVLVGAWMIVNSIITISEVLDFPSYLLSFFAIAVGTSLPELGVGLAAIRNERFEFVLGNIMGSNIADVTISMATGPLFFPNVLDAGIATAGGAYMLLASFIVIGLFAWKMRITKKMGLLFLLIYLLSLVVLPAFA